MNTPSRGDPRLARRPAYVLWLIRTERATNLPGLFAYFGEPIGGPPLSSIPHLLLKSLKQLHSVGLIEGEDWDTELRATPLANSLRELFGISLTELAQSDPDGSLFLSPVFGRPESVPGAADVFVLMPFTEALSPVYQDHIRPVCEALGYSVRRADDVFGVSEIMQDIWNFIAAAQVLVADCTGRNANVFYELGVAHTLGKPVVLITQTADDVPFDLRHRRYLQYTYTPRGMAAFEGQLRATIMETFVPGAREA